jgi:polyvinyl alcohol dehydrogenase (cytochrome)
VPWGFPERGAAGTFRASPIVQNETVYVGSSNGYFYALEAATGALRWQYPSPGSAALLPANNTSHWNDGIQSSAAYWDRGRNGGAVIFAAQDPTWGDYGSASLFVLDAATGALIWRSSQPVAVINGNTLGSATELHERVANSAPLLFNNRVYIGIAVNGDNPIQHGRVIAVDLATGLPRVSTFNYASVQAGKPGGDVWNAPATDGRSVYFTTGNTRCPMAAMVPNHPSPRPITD